MKVYAETTYVPWIGWFEGVLVRWRTKAIAAALAGHARGRNRPRFFGIIAHWRAQVGYNETFARRLDLPGSRHWIPYCSRPFAYCPSTENANF